MSLCRVVLDGVPDGVADYRLPVRELTVAVSAAGAFAAAHVVISQELLDARSERPTGGLKVTDLQGATVYFQSAVYTFDYTYTGLEQIGFLIGSGAFWGPVTQNLGVLPVLQELAGFSPTPRYRVPLTDEVSFRPVLGDTVTCNGRTFIVGSATWKLSTTYSYVEISDGAGVT